MNVNTLKLSLRSHANQNQAKITVENIILFIKFTNKSSLILLQFQSNNISKISKIPFRYSKIKYNRFSQLLLNIIFVSGYVRDIA